MNLPTGVLPESLTTTYRALVYEVKNILIDELRESFSTITDYQYIPSDSGGPDLVNTKIVITDTYTYDAKFLPCILLSLGGGSNKPISFNQNYRTILAMNVQNEERLVYQFAGAWETTATVTIATEDTISREELSGVVSLIFEHLKRYQLIRKGIYIHQISWAGETEQEYANDYVYMLNISLGVYSEWYNWIVISDVIESIEVSIGNIPHTLLLPDNLRPIKNIGGTVR